MQLPSSTLKCKHSQTQNSLASFLSSYLLLYFFFFIASFSDLWDGIQSTKYPCLPLPQRSGIHSRIPNSVPLMATISHSKITAPQNILMFAPLPNLIITYSPHISRNVPWNLREFLKESLYRLFWVTSSSSSVPGMHRFPFTVNLLYDVLLFARFVRSLAPYSILDSYAMD